MVDDQAGSQSHTEDVSKERSNVTLWKRVLIIAVLAVTVGGLYLAFGDLFKLSALAGYESTFLDFGRRNLAAMIAIAFAAYVVITAASLPAAGAVTLLYGWLFARLMPGGLGVVTAVILVSFASTAGATISFLISRYLLRETIRDRFPRYAERFDRAFRDEGAFYLFTLRLIPAVPFFVINAVMGLTPIRVLTFWWVSQLGMLPGTVVYILAGAQVPTLEVLAQRGISSVLTWPTLIAFAALGLFPLFARFIIKKLAPDVAKRASEAPDASHESTRKDANRE
ncbi:TVP38/TMEM64 family protein [Stratiformator vulcanicus]|uniref:TVP38/TMEM64 family membrane protein n=1 Tax=Stratiformator vulcanicus TaxID=2527980 RepID=A0A517R473_9PLAN|nr:VTT domain-containing protein [Stratiformator vulcanicus]QDT38692.1 TVP38/TMEM64 family inner membrane protein YdjZ [Stratiformator vulcanicus]